ncbi:MAG TPA: hypothetical protein VIH89_13700 [Candidatus Sulfotelmatobacter sp.]
MNCICGGTDYINHQVGVGEHGNVAAGDLSHFGAHPLGNEPFHVGVDGAVVFADMYQLGFDLQAVPSTFALNKSGLGTP